VGRTPKRSGRASTLRAAECEGPGGATVLAEGQVLCQVVSEQGWGVLFVQVTGSSRHNAA
jgi:hypothetical protein